MCFCAPLSQALAFLAEPSQGPKGRQAALSLLSPGGSLPGRHRHHLKGLQAPLVPRLRMSLIGTDEMPLLLGKGSARGYSSAQISARSDGSRAESAGYTPSRFQQSNVFHDGNPYEAEVAGSEDAEVVSRGGPDLQTYYIGIFMSCFSCSPCKASSSARLKLL